jgi:hypothetical protein
MKGSAKVNWGQHRQNLDKHLTDIIEGLVKNKVAELLRDLLPELANQVVEQLKKSGKTLLADLQSELTALPVVTSTAAYREAPVDQWPTNDHVPGYFEPAVNEVVLTKTDTFAATFKEHLATETGKDPAQFEAAMKEAAQQVILRALMPKGTEEMKFFTTWDHSVLNNITHPHVIRTNEWKPSRITNPPTLPAFRLKLTTRDLLSFSNKWIGVNQSAFDQYCRTTLTAWLAQGGANEEKLIQLFDDAVNYAKPLVTIDDGAAKFFHDSEPGPKIEYVFSKLPFARSSIAVNRMKEKYPEFGKAFEEACDPASQRTEVTISSRFGDFYLPWAMESLTKPIREAYDTLRLGASGRNDFWHLQRSRVLSQALPVGEDVIEAMLRGYFVGRITGRVLVRGSVVSIFIPGESSGGGRWVDFPSDLLGGKVIGLSQGGESTDKLNIPVVLLESLPLALVKVYGTSHESMTPYLELFRLGKNLKKYRVGVDVSPETKTELDEWFLGEGQFQPVTKSEPNSLELKTEAEGIITHWKIEAEKAWSAVPRDSQSREWQIFGELAPNIVRACTGLIEELNRTEPKLGELPTGDANVTDVVSGSPISDEDAVY